MKKLKKVLKVKKAAEKKLQALGKKGRKALEGSKKKAIADMEAGVRF